MNLIKNFLVLASIFALTGCASSTSQNLKDMSKSASNAGGLGLVVAGALYGLGVAAEKIEESDSKKEPEETYSPIADELKKHEPSKEDAPKNTI